MVVSVARKGAKKQLRMEGGGLVDVHALACVGKGDSVRTDADGRVWVRTDANSTPVVPGFRWDTLYKVAEGVDLKLEATELVTEADFESYSALSQFHYRSETGFGRRSVLLLRCGDSLFPNVVGFIEVTTPFLHLRNRNKLMDAPFAEPGSAISWTKWDLETRSKYVQTIARISRVVVHPELRGLGLTKPLFAAATKYARERWHVRGMRPLFLEITADMLRFMPFLGGSGLRYIGESDGNAGRLAKDIAYLSRASQRDGSDSHSVLSGRGKGILRRQKRDIDLVTRLRDQLDPDAEIEDFIERLLSSADVDDVANEMLLPLLRFPKPTYLRGLTKTADAFLLRRTAELHLSAAPAAIPQPALCSGPVTVRDLTLSYHIDTGKLSGRGSGEVRRAFGLERSFRFRTGISRLSFSVHPGEVAFVFGASGSGKTTLVDLLSGTHHSGTVSIEGSVGLPHDARVGMLEPVSAEMPLMTAIGARDLATAIYALNAAGLAEPRLYLSTFDQLSAGQRYRAGLARLICSDSNVWLLDEFAAGLDDATSIALGRNFARAARQMGVILIVATVRRRPLVNSMTPDIVVHLSQLEDPKATRDWHGWAGLPT